MNNRNLGPQGSRGVGVEIEVIRTGRLAASRITQLRSMLKVAFDGEFTEHDWNHTIGGWHVIVSVGGQITSHAAVVERRIWSAEVWFDTGYLEGVATVPTARHRGFGTIATTAATEIVRDSFQLGALSTGAHEFYAALGWEAWRGTTWVQTSSGPQRTPDEDDAIMVLRFGPSINLALNGEIRCEARPGDDW